MKDREQLTFHSLLERLRRLRSMLAHLNENHKDSPAVRSPFHPRYASAAAETADDHESQDSADLSRQLESFRDEYVRTFDDIRSHYNQISLEYRLTDMPLRSPSELRARSNLSLFPERIVGVERIIADLDGQMAEIRLDMTEDEPPEVDLPPSAAPHDQDWDPRAFGVSVKAARRQADMSQDNLAEALACSGSTISRIENGKQSPHPELRGTLRGLLSNREGFRAAWEARKKTQG